MVIEVACSDKIVWLYTRIDYTLLLLFDSSS